jgi:hypothetical protein
MDYPESDANTFSDPIKLVAVQGGYGGEIEYIITRLLVAVGDSDSTFDTGL